MSSALSYDLHFDRLHPDQQSITVPSPGLATAFNRSVGPPMGITARLQLRGASPSTSVTVRYHCIPSTLGEPMSWADFRVELVRRMAFPLSSYTYIYPWGIHVHVHTHVHAHAHAQVRRMAFPLSVMFFVATMVNRRVRASHHTTPCHACLTTTHPTPALGYCKHHLPPTTYHRSPTSCHLPPTTYQTAPSALTALTRPHLHCALTFTLTPTALSVTFASTNPSTPTQRRHRRWRVTSVPENPPYATLREDAQVIIATLSSLPLLPYSQLQTPRDHEHEHESANAEGGAELSGAELSAQSSRQECARVRVRVRARARIRVRVRMRVRVRIGVRIQPNKVDRRSRAPRDQPRPLYSLGPCTLWSHVELQPSYLPWTHLRMAFTPSALDGLHTM